MTKNVENKTVKILSTQGSELGQMNLEGSVFGVEPNMHVMYLALKRQLNTARAGLACAKTRAEVSGGGKKPWKQKGTGRARAGSLRSPLFRGGGVIFGPKPRSYETALPQKARKLALKSALSANAKSKSIILVDEIKYEAAKTKAAVEMLNNLKTTNKTLFVVSENSVNYEALMSVANLQNVMVLFTDEINVYDVVNSDSIVMTVDAVKTIEEVLA